jgi:hypothetical protein
MKAVYVYADNILRYLPETQQCYNYFKAGFNFELSKNLGFGIEYSLGFDSPKFLKEDKLDAALTIEF